MFICERCLDENFINFAIAFSYGKCEYCDKTALCCDIPSKYLIRKTTPNKYSPDTGVLINIGVQST